MISHYGTEHYCPLSLLRVLGTSFIQEYEDSEELSSTSEAATTPTIILEGLCNLIGQAVYTTCI